MRYFDPTMARGVLGGVTTPLPGDNWIVGPLDEGDGTMVLAARSR